MQERPPDDREVIHELRGRVAELERSNGELSRALEDWQAIFDATNDALWILGTDHRVIRTNQTAERMFRRPCGEMVGRFCWEIVHGTAEPHPNCPVVRMRASRRRETMLLEVGSRWFEVTVDPILDAAGRHAGAVHIVSDVTERVRDKTALAESEARFRAFFDNAPVGKCMTAPDGRLLRVNQAFADMLGYSVAELTNRPFTEVTLPDDIEDNQRGVRELLAGGRNTWQFEKHYVAKDGRNVPATVTTCVLRDSRAQPLMLLTHVQDITDRKGAEAVLAKSTAQMRGMFKSLTDAITFTDLRSVIVDTNDAAVRMHGYGCREELIGKNAFDLIADSDQARAARSAQTTLDRGHSGIVEYRVKRKTGEEFDVELNSVLLRDERGNATGFVALTRDITERKQVEANLANALHYAETIFEHSPVGILTCRASGEVVSANPALIRMSGGDKEQLLRQNFRNLASWRESGMQLVADHALASGSVATLEAHSVTTFGKDRWVSCTFVPFSYGNEPFLLGMLTDVTEQRHAEERLREQAALLNAANDAICVRTLEHVVTYWNEGAERLYGYTRADALGRAVTDLVDRDRATFVAANAVLLERGSWAGEMKKTSKTGSESLAFCRWTLLRTHAGQPREILAIDTDITEKKQLEANFLRAQRMESVGALAGGIAHDLNNILAPILMTSSLLRETTNDVESLEMLATLEACAERGGNIIGQLLTFARGKPGARVPLPMRHLLGEMEKIVRETFPRNITVGLDVAEDLWPALGDATQVHQALMNLCVNARDAMPEGGTLVLAAANRTLDRSLPSTMPEARPGRYVCVSVSDTGTGIPPADVDRIFDPFFTTKEPGKGTGLGLAAVLGIVRGHDGFVRVESRLGAGTTFELNLPASPAARALPTVEPDALPPRGQGELILVVDDEATIRSVVQGLLEKHGYRVLTANEGAQALALFAERRAEVSAVLTDMMMPGVDGLALVRAIRELDAGVPIVAMTGLGERASLEGLRDLDLSVVITKPFSRVELLAALREVFAGPRS
jgi:PAS domain S-box-containing protein